MAMTRELTLGSLFDGSGGFPLGGLLAGIRPVWASEIEPFPIRVTTRRFPSVRHYGDISEMNGGVIEPVDVITFGSPCTDMSLAGKRAGLHGKQSCLFYDAVRIVKEMREATDGRYPRFIVWENVTGAFSSNKGADFQSVLEAVCSVKGYTIDSPRPEKWPNAGEIVADDFSLAWRVLDAQYWGVPQRRKRIYLVADFTGQGAGKILFKSEGVSGNLEEGGKSWQRAAGSSENRSGTSGLCLNDQGGSRMEVSKGVTGTLCAQQHSHQSAVLQSAGFCTEHSAKARSIGYEEEKSPTLRAGVVPATVYENHSQDSRYGGPLSVAPAITRTYGAGGNNQPLVVEDAKTYDVRFTSEGTRNARQNCYETDTARTLDTGGNAPDSNQGGVAVVNMKAFGISSDSSHAMRSDNPHAGIYEADTSRTLDTRGGDPACNQGGIAVVAIEGNGTRPSHKGSGYSEDGVSFTLNTTEQHAVAFAEKSAALLANDGPKGASSQQIGNPENFAAVYHSSKNSYHTRFSDEDATDTLVATDYKDPPTVTAEPEYIVRRLTPLECARLQGFPDWWCAGLETENPTEEEIAFWREVFETHRRIVTGAKKSKTDKQIRKWLRNPHTDGAEYKMWGNGVALPCVYYVMAGIAHFAQET
ncbi:DNA (cytosine-5-)-methyltransferase [Selenomonas bovis]|uniref:Cytosine-specific methyltransferase n=2 Tax=Selenomonas bovis TaxID=416586 RepID=A0A848BBS5_9FIRM|nr:DNA (cytosine-5-)-methyltransferase [Selenomonas bovis]